MAARNPMLTRNGRTRLNPLSITQLTTILENTNTLPKIKSKVQSRIKVLTSRTS